MAALGVRPSVQSDTYKRNTKNTSHEHVTRARWQELVSVDSWKDLLNNEGLCKVAFSNQYFGLGLRQGNTHLLRQLVYPKEGASRIMAAHETAQEILRCFVHYCCLFKDSKFRTETGGPNFPSIKEIRVTTTRSIDPENLSKNFTKHDAKGASAVWRGTQGNRYKMSPSCQELLNMHFSLIVDSILRKYPVLLNAKESIIAQFGCDFTYEVQYPDVHALENALLSALKLRMPVEPVLSDAMVSYALNKLCQAMNDMIGSKYLRIGEC